jgi:hypothetical protein
LIDNHERRPVALVVLGFGVLFCICYASAEFVFPEWRFQPSALALVPDRPDPRPQTKAVDLSGEWEVVASREELPRVSFIIHRSVNVYRMESVESPGTGILDGKVLTVLFDFVPIQGRYRYLGRFELIDGKLVGECFRSDSDKENYYMTIQRKVKR